MPRRTTVLLVGLLAAVIPFGAASLATPSAAQQAPVIRLDGPDPMVPHLAPASFSIGIDGVDLPPEVTVTLSGDGVTPQPTSRTVDTTQGQPYLPRAEFTVSTQPGLHRLTVTATADGAEPAVVEYDVWAPFGAPIPSTGDLSGRSWLWSGAYDTEDGRYTLTYSTTLMFLDARRVFVGNPTHGVPTCRGRDRTYGCTTYRYDESGSGLVQIGGETRPQPGNNSHAYIGRLTDVGLYVDGLGPAGEYYAGNGWGRARVFRQVVAPQRLGARFSGRWTGPLPYNHFTRDVPPRISLRLDRDGSFVWRRHGVHVNLVRRGAYRIRAHGLLRIAWGQRHKDLTFLPCVDDRGRPIPDRCLVLSYSHGNGTWSAAVLTEDGDPRIDTADRDRAAD